MIRAVPLLCGVGSMPVWSMCLFLVMRARGSLQPCKLFPVFEVSMSILFYMECMNYFVIFNYGMCNVPD